MIISHKHHFIFIKTRKTAGTSIEIALSQFCGPKDVITPLLREDELIRKKLGFRGPQNHKYGLKYPDQKIENLRRWLLGKKIRSVNLQHSNAKFIKDYVGEDIWNNYYKFCIERNPFDKAISLYYWSIRKMTNVPEINDFIQMSDPKMMTNWLFYTIDDQITVDFIGRYEALGDDLKNVTEKLRIPLLSLPLAKGYSRANRQHFSQLLNNESRRYIEEICTNEIEKFGYKWECK